MNHLYTSSITIWVFIIIIKENVSSVTSKLVPLQKNDPREWRENGAEANFAQFNSLYAIRINEENLRSDKYCSGRCDSMDLRGANIARYLSYPDRCAGLLRSCWLDQVSAPRSKAEADFKNSYVSECKAGLYYPICSPAPGPTSPHFYNILVHTGNICKCLCERDELPNAANERGELLDSICYDPVSVDNGYVATGARFKRHGNVMYLELQQGILSQGKIDPKTLKWTTSNDCNLKKKVINNVRYDGSCDGLEIILNDLTLSENAVVTGVTFDDSLRGRYVDDDGNINENESEFTQKIQCHRSAIDLVHRDPDLLPSTALIGSGNYERSLPCDWKIIFGVTKESSDNIQHVVPFVDIQEVVTDQNSPQPIHGIGWYYRGYPGYGGYLALKIFTKE